LEVRKRRITVGGKVTKTLFHRTSWMWPLTSVITAMQEAEVKGQRSEVKSARPYLKDN
jgi:hypothetical protein